MVTTAYIKLWGRRVGAVAWDEDQKIGFFEYDKKFASGGLEVAPVRIPLSNRIYSFPELRDTKTFRGIPGKLSRRFPVVQKVIG